MILEAVFIWVPPVADPEANLNARRLSDGWDRRQQEVGACKGGERGLKGVRTPVISRGQGSALPASWGQRGTHISHSPRWRAARAPWCLSISSLSFLVGAASYCSGTGGKERKCSGWQRTACVQGRCQRCGRGVSASRAPRAMGTRSPRGEKRACLSPFRLLW